MGQHKLKKYYRDKKYFSQAEPEEENEVKDSGEEEDEKEPTGVIPVLDQGSQSNLLTSLKSQIGTYLDKKQEKYIPVRNGRKYSTRKHHIRKFYSAKAKDKRNRPLETV